MFVFMILILNSLLLSLDCCASHISSVLLILGSVLLTSGLFCENSPTPIAKGNDSVEDPLAGPTDANHQPSTCGSLSEGDPPAQPSLDPARGSGGVPGTKNAASAPACTREPYPCRHFAPTPEPQQLPVG